MSKDGCNAPKEIGTRLTRSLTHGEILKIGRRVVRDTPLAYKQVYKSPTRITEQDEADRRAGRAA